jgi:hypothetical protein
LHRFGGQALGDCADISLVLNPAGTAVDVLELVEEEERGWKNLNGVPKGQMDNSKKVQTIPLWIRGYVFSAASILTVRIDSRGYSYIW